MVKSPVGDVKNLEGWVNVTYWWRYGWHSPAIQWPPPFFHQYKRPPASFLQPFQCNTPTPIEFFFLYLTLNFFAQFCHLQFLSIFIPFQQCNYGTYSMFLGGKSHTRRRKESAPSMSYNSKSDTSPALLSIAQPIRQSIVEVVGRRWIIKVLLVFWDSTLGVLNNSLKCGRSCQ